MPSFWSLIPFYLISLLIGIILPVTVVIALIWRFSRGNAKPKLAALAPFIVCLILLGIVANIFWDQIIFNHIYYEWDRFYLPYTFLWHEAPVLDASTSWMAIGWTKAALDLVWLVISITIYLVAGFVAFYFAKMKRLGAVGKVVVRSMVTLFLISFLIFLASNAFS